MLIIKTLIMNTFGSKLLTASKIGFYTTGSLAFMATGYTLCPKSKFMQMKQKEHNSVISTNNAIMDGMSATNKLFGFGLTELKALKEKLEKEEQE